jgi:hypothetical protein
MELSVLEQLAYNCIRIECVYKNGGTGTGTGFFVHFLDDGQGRGIPVIVTNKHVIKDSVYITLVFSHADSDGNFTDTKHYTVQVPSTSGRWKMHPDPTVDLCAMPIADILIQHQRAGINLAYIPLPANLIKPTSPPRVDLNAVEEVLMIGYPIGLWDDINNQPVFRRGVTATHPLKDYKGKKEFMIDMACFPGSSGSPVFIYKSGMTINKQGMTLLEEGIRIELLGVLYAGPQMAITGEIKVLDIPTVQTAVSVSNTMINLGYVIKAEQILILENLFR